MTRALMLQGTGSDVGKSLLVAGLARAFTRRGLKVRPFKPQNMSNNAAVTDDGGEIGRAQALQARACGVVAGQRHEPGAAEAAIGRRGADRAVRPGAGQRRGARIPHAWRRVCCRRCSPPSTGSPPTADLVLVEGAGSPAEINLRAGDIANMGFAEAADVPVALVGDIERGGVIAQLVGTHALLSPAERGRLAGYIVNKFRGDVRLFDGGIAAIGERTGLAMLRGRAVFRRRRAASGRGFAGAARPHPHPRSSRAAESEASPLPHAGEGAARSEAGEGGRVKIAVPLLPRIANFDDLDPLRAEPGVDLVMVRPGQPLPRDAALVILPGSKATLADLAFLRREGWDIDILAHRRQGGHVLGLCGGYQMLGRRIADPDGREGHARRGGGARAARHRYGARPATSGSAKPPAPISRPACRCAATRCISA